ncbi:MAG: hypothetical protein PVF74_02290, partial [Anaerolineales bacterium]
GSVLEECPFVFHLRPVFIVLHQRNLDSRLAFLLGVVAIRYICSSEWFLPGHMSFGLIHEFPRQLS